MNMSIFRVFWFQALQADSLTAEVLATLKQMRDWSDENDLFLRSNQSTFQPPISTTPHQSFMTQQPHYPPAAATSQETTTHSLELLSMTPAIVSQDYFLFFPGITEVAGI